MKYIVTLILLVNSINVQGDICSEGIDPSNEKEWVISNMCHYKNTALVFVESGKLRNWYNPLTHIRAEHLAFEYEIKVLEAYRGVEPNTTCMIEGTEAKFVISAGNSGTNQIVSFNEFDKCIFVDVGAMQESNEQLEAYAKYVAKQLSEPK